jgi:hypothetical protein
VATTIELAATDHSRLEDRGLALTPTTRPKMGSVYDMSKVIARLFY